MLLKLYAISVPVFFAIDMVWLGLVARNFYRQQIGSLMKDDVNWVAAFVFYAIFLFGLTTFVLEPAVAQKSLQYACVRGALFGFVCYATYDLTNLAVAKDWPLTVTVVDMIWGAVLCSSVSAVTMSIYQKFFA